MINPLHLRGVVIEPTLKMVHAHSRDLEQLMVECAYFESMLCGLWSNEEVDRPLGVGMWGITPAEHHEITLWMHDNQTWSRTARRLVPKPAWQHMTWNLAYSALMAAGLLHMRVEPVLRWPSTWEDRHWMWEHFWMEEPGFMHPMAWKKRLRFLGEAEQPMGGRRQVRWSGPRVADMPGRWAPQIESFAL